MTNTGVYAVFHLYRSRYSFVADHFLKDGHHVVTFSDLTHALKFTSQSSAQRFINDDLNQTKKGSYFTTELTMDELLIHCPELYEIRRALSGGVA